MRGEDAAFAPLALLVYAARILRTLRCQLWGFSELHLLDTPVPPISCHGRGLSSLAADLVWSAPYGRRETWQGAKRVLLERGVIELKLMTQAARP
ncbi:hypothetical protein NDU88_002980 [Pleurodeles waltl]|uniref:Uncharacterized protein n=1 Tax=Pleurodeles waltl TaxID=8319 RepID=A0AAV7KUA0_PLEWA|nr:hypothetical protein NDU88_002980 [Pleurodeles waltl]